MAEAILDAIECKSSIFIANITGFDINSHRSIGTAIKASLTYKQLGMQNISFRRYNVRDA